MKIIAYVISMAFFIGGMVLMGQAFEPSGGEALTFGGGILCIAISLVIPFSVLKRLDG